MKKRLASQTDRTLGYESPLFRAATVTPNDTAEMPFLVRGFMIGVDGDVSVQLVDNTSDGEQAAGDIVTLANLKAGIIYPFLVQHVRATGTTATGIVVLG